MKHLLFFAILFTGIAASAQTYPKYSNQAGNSKAASKPESAKKETAVKVVEEAAAKGNRKPEGDFQELMEKAVVQSKARRYEAAVMIYSKALEVSNEEQAWRALISRATNYQMIGQFDKAMADYTTIINAQNAPQKNLAYIYSCRARLAQEKNDMELACADVKKARELGLPEMAMQGINCK
ncbi:hypothetical protein HYN59_12295 [Flavobacterium album]|uniref:Uncharacterized protein n=1 Tax=Flavobacterium album TaxID=2175091 RepID=A0A2S1QZM5_9FLAO|nr:hypothetical protein [Flavobacterium album]AWH85836.1 hypothetical protein HYN59_12295 [Flavobacterium album]